MVDALSAFLFLLSSEIAFQFFVCFYCFCLFRMKRNKSEKKLNARHLETIRKAVETCLYFHCEKRRRNKTTEAKTDKKNLFV